MKSAHFVETQSRGKRFFRGALCDSYGFLLRDIYDILDHAFALHLLTPLYFRFFRWHIIDAPFTDDDLITSLDDLCHVLSAYAAPGYEFTAWIIQGRKVWGWFPREG